MREVVIVDAVRSAIGKRGGGLAHAHANGLLGGVLSGLLERNDLTGAEVDAVLGGCVVQLGMPAANVTRNAWLTAGLPLEVAAATVNSQCGSSQEAHRLAHAQIASGLADVAVACGVEVMSRVPMGSNMPPGGPHGDPRGGEYAEVYEPTDPGLEGADRIAEKWGLRRPALDEFAKLSQDRAARAWEQDRFERDRSCPSRRRSPTTRARSSGRRRSIGTRACGRHTLEGLATLRPRPRPIRVPASYHTGQGNSSRISDGASAVLLASREKADELGLRPRARVVDSVLVGSDPVLVLTGPIPATAALLARTGLALWEMDVVEINEAFAAVVGAWAAEFDADMDRVNVNGGAMAATGTPSAPPAPS